MKMSLKIALSLLISVVTFTAFFVIASSGLFNIIETALFVPRIKEDYGRSLEKTVSEMDTYHKNMKARFEAVLAHDYIPTAFLANQSQSKTDISLRDESFGRLMQLFPDLELVRFISEDGKFLHYSTRKSDISLESPGLRSYYLYDQVEKNIKGPALVVRSGEAPKVTIDGFDNRFVYSFPITDGYGIYKGTALFYVSTRDIVKMLATVADIQVREPVSLIDTAGMLIGVPEQKIGDIKEEILASWQRNGNADAYSEAIGITVKDNPASGTYFLFSRRSAEQGLVAVVAPKALFEIGETQKIIIYIIFFVTVYLVVFIVFNFRQDPITILNERIKLLQVSFIKQSIESKNELDWSKWHAELSSKRPEIAGFIRKGIGRLNKKQKEEIDSLINRGWDEILSIVTRKAEQENREQNFDMSRIEEIITKALAQGNIVIPARRVEEAPEKPVPAVIETEKRIDDLKTSEEPDAVNEIEEIGEDSIEEAEEIGSGEGAGTEDAEEIETAEEAEQVTEAESPGEIAEEELIMEEAEPVAEETIEVRSRIEAEQEATFVEPLDMEEKPEESIDTLDVSVESLVAVPEIDEGKDALFEEELDEVEESEYEGLPQDLDIEPDEIAGSKQADEVARSIAEFEEIELESIEEKTDFTEFSADANEEENPEEAELSDRVEEHDKARETTRVTAHEETDARRIALSEDSAGTLKRLFDRVDEEITKKEKQTFNVPEKNARSRQNQGGELEELESIKDATLFAKVTLDDLPELELVETAADYLDYKRGGKYFLLPKKRRISLFVQGETTENDDAGFDANRDGDGDEIVDFQNEGDALIKELMKRESVPGEVADAKTQEYAPEKEIEGLLKTKKIVVYSISEMLQVYGSLKNSIVVEGGVYRIRKDLFAGPDTGGDSELKQLVHSVSGETQEEADNETVRFDVRAREIMASPKVTVRTRGIEYDNYMRSITKKTDDITIVKSLVTLSRKLESIYAGIVTEQDGKYKMEYSVGLQDLTKKLFLLPETDPYVMFFFMQKRAFLINLPVGETVSMGKYFSEYDRKFLNGLAFLPATFKGRDAYLFLGFPKYEQRDLRTIFAGLGV